MRAILIFVSLCLACLVQAQMDLYGRPLIRWSVIAQGNDSAIQSPTKVTLISEGDLQRHWMKHKPGSSAPLTNIDWNKEWVFAIHLGKRTSGGYSVRVESIDVSGHEVRVNYVEEMPRRGSATSSALTSPYVIIRATRTAGNPVFVGRTCESRTGGGGWHPVQYPYSLTYRILSSYFTCRATYGGTCMLDTQKKLEQYWVDVLGKDLQRERPPLVDWLNWCVVGVNLGAQSNYPCQMSIVDVCSTDASTVTIYYTRTRLTSQISGQCSPYALVMMPRWTGSIRTQCVDDVRRF